MQSNSAAGESFASTQRIRVWASPHVELRPKPHSTTLLLESHKLLIAWRKRNWFCLKFETRSKKKERKSKVCLFHPLLQSYCHRSNGSQFQELFQFRQNPPDSFSFDDSFLLRFSDVRSTEERFLFSTFSDLFGERWVPLCQEKPKPNMVVVITWETTLNITIATLPLCLWSSSAL